MESSFKKSVIQGNKLVGLAEKADGSLERGNDDVWNASLACKLTCQVKYSSGSHTMDIKIVDAKTTSSLFYAADDGVQAQMCNGVASTVPFIFPPVSQVFAKAAEYGSISLLNNGYLGSSLNSCDNGDPGAPAYILKPSQAQPTKFNVQLSEACGRKFVMFDHRSKKRMNFHPTMMNALLPASLQTTSMYNLLENSFVGEDTNMVRSPFLACISSLNDSASMSLRSSGSDNCDTCLLADKENTRSQIEENNLNGSSELSCFSHENTEDLEALLSVDEDEESSIGHSPSDLTWNPSLADCPTVSGEGYRMCDGKKRKRECESGMDDDMRSTAATGNKSFKGLCSQKVLGADSNSACIGEHCLASQEAALLRPMTGCDSAAVDIPDEVHSSSSANNKRKCKKLPSSQQQLQQLRIEQSRKEKIRNILNFLRGVIPGGESIGTAFVLDEAIEYVRALQSQVQELQAWRKLT